MVKVGLSGSGVVALAGVAAVAAVGWMLYAKRGAITQAVATVGQSLNPTSSDNLVNSTVETIGRKTTGDPSWTLGGWLAEQFSPSVRAANESLRAKPPQESAQAETDRLARRYPAPSGYGSVIPVQEGAAEETARMLARYPAQREGLLQEAPPGMWPEQEPSDRAPPVAILPAPKERLTGAPLALVPGGRSTMPAKVKKGPFDPGQALRGFN